MSKQLLDILYMPIYNCLVNHFSAVVVNKEQQEQLQQQVELLLLLLLLRSTINICQLTPTVSIFGFFIFSSYRYLFHKVH